MTPERLKKQQDFIISKLEKYKLKKYGLTLVDDNTIIIDSMMDTLCNTVQKFFKGGMFSEKKCEHCGTCDESKQFDRAHNKGSSRRDVAYAALHRIRPDESQPIQQRAFLRAFIEEHCNVPLWILCKPCHLNYDKTPM